MKRWLLPGAACLIVLVACEPTTPVGSSGQSLVPASSPTSSVAPDSVTTTATTAPVSAAARGSALAALAYVAVKGRAPLTGYTRAQFGPAWEDVDHNGCDTRNDILRRDLVAKVFSGSCTVLSGVLHDPYTARTIAFRRGVGTSSVVQIDHVVALGDAWQTGAQQLSAATRLAFANDPLELLAVSGSANQQKGDADAASWLPANKAFRCQYVARQVAVKIRYHLWMTAAEKAAVARVLSACPRQVLPTGGAPLVIAGAVIPTAVATTPARTPVVAVAATRIVHPGAFCSPEGALGVTVAGTPMICKLDSKGLRLRWGRR
jgi:Protein of unknown function (DUF1524)